MKTAPKCCAASFLVRESSGSCTVRNCRWLAANPRNARIKMEISVENRDALAGRAARRAALLARLRRSCGYARAHGGAGSADSVRQSWRHLQLASRGRSHGADSGTESQVVQGDADELLYQSVVCRTARL